MSNDAGGGLTPLGKGVIAAVVLVLVVVGLWLVTSSSNEEKGADQPKDIDIAKAQGQLADQPKDQPKTDGEQLEKIDLTGITTVKEYAYIPADTLPPVTGVSSYSWDEANKVVEFPINMWIGWLPIVAANNGFVANEESVFFKKYGFKVNLTLIDDPVAARDAFAAGKSHVLWGTVDMMVIFATELMRDSRTAPRIFQQIDWSNGGDGIIVRDAISTVRDLQGKTIVYAQNSPSQYYINALLINAGVQPSSVTHKYTATAFEAAAAFVSDPSIDACVSWAPDIYNIPEKVPGTKVLSTTADANKLIADVWAVRADFAKDHPEVVKGLVAGIFEGMQMVQKDPAPAIAAMSKGFGLPVDEIQAMTADAHLTNFAENKKFFLNQNNPTNFERTWGAISFVYRELGIIGSPAPFDQVMDFSVIKAIDEDGTFKEQTDDYKTKFAPQSYAKITAEAPILTQSLRINFFPNSYNLDEKARDEYGTILEEQLYDPYVDETLERAGRLSGQFEAAIIAVTGHTDASMKGLVPEEGVKDLSEKRANAVADRLIEKYGFDRAKFVVKGAGWDSPADASDPNNHFLNRRVEVAVYPPEQQ